MTRAAALLFVGLLASVVPARARAADTLDLSAAARERARAAYDLGRGDHERGDYASAARRFAEADAVAPTGVALSAALEAAVLADDPALGAELLERSASRPSTPALTAAIASAERRLGGRAGRVVVTCPNSARCRATIDGEETPTGRDVWTRVGARVVVVTTGGDTQSRSVEVRPGVTTRVDVARGADVRASTSTSDEPAGGREKPLAPIVFWVGAGATLLAGAVMTGAMIDASGRQRDFVDAGCERAPEIGCAALRDGGQSAQTTANVMIGATAVLAAATVLVGVLFTRWDGPAAPATRTDARSFARGFEF